jgi:exopolysaccharide production protein ExoQ
MREMPAKRRMGREASRKPAHSRITSQGIQFADHGLVLIALSALVANAIFGMIAIAVFIIASLVLLALHPADCARALMRFFPLLMLPLLATLSTLWSDAPQVTLRAGLQLMLTFVVTIVVFRRADVRLVIIALFAAFFLLCLTALPSVPGSFARAQPLVGLLGSKNALGFGAHFCFALALALIWDATQPNVVRLAGLCTLPVTSLLIYLSHSAGAQTSAVLTLVIFPALVVFGHFRLSLRVMAAGAIVVFLATAMPFLTELQFALTDFRANVLNKDVSLTGRTYLWEFASRLSAERPWLGYGYSAFWRKGNVDAEGLWRWGGIASRTGFNFHNAFVEMKVDLGLVGQTIMIATCIGITSVGMIRQMLRPSVPMAFFLALQAVLYVRSATETGLIGPFSLMTVLWLAGAVYAMAPEALARTKVITAGIPDGLRPSLFRSRVVGNVRGE